MMRASCCAALVVFCQSLVLREPEPESTVVDVEQEPESTVQEPLELESAVLEMEKESLPAAFQEIEPVVGEEAKISIEATEGEDSANAVLATQQELPLATGGVDATNATLVTGVCWPGHRKAHKCKTIKNEHSCRAFRGCLWRAVGTCIGHYKSKDGLCSWYRHSAEKCEKSSMCYWLNLLALPTKGYCSGHMHHDIHFCQDARSEFGCNQKGDLEGNRCYWSNKPYELGTCVGLTYHKDHGCMAHHSSESCASHSEHCFFLNRREAIVNSWKACHSNTSLLHEHKCLMYRQPACLSTDGCVWYR